MARDPEPMLTGLDRTPSWFELTMLIAGIISIALAMLAMGYHFGLADGQERGFIEGQIAEMQQRIRLQDTGGDHQ